MDRTDSGHVTASCTGFESEHDGTRSDAVLYPVFCMFYASFHRLVRHRVVYCNLDQVLIEYPRQLCLTKSKALCKVS
jgi:hypothetical protein